MDSCCNSWILLHSEIPKRICLDRASVLKRTSDVGLPQGTSTHFGNEFAGVQEGAEAVARIFILAG